MFEIKVISSRFSTGKIIGVDDGNFHLLAGVRFCCTLFTEDRQVLDKQVIVVKGKDFETMMNEINGIEYLKNIILDQMECKENI